MSTTIDPLPADLSRLDMGAVNAATAERQTLLRTIFDQAGAGYDMSRVTVISGSSTEKASQLKAISDDLDRLKEWRTPMTHPTAGRGFGGGASGGSFYSAIMKAGWDPVARSRVQIPAGAALFAADFGDDIGGMSVHRIGPSLIGQDRRYVYPALKSVGISAADTSVSYLKQSSRALADPDLMVRAIDATSEKPVSSFGAAINSVTPSQVAHRIPGIPNIVARQRMFVDLIEGEMRLGLSEALDAMVVAAIDAETIPAGASGVGIGAGIRKAVTVVTAAGYSPDTVALGPDDDEALDLLLLSLNNSTGTSPLFNLRRRVSKATTDPFVFDSSAFATLIAGPVEFASFEENAGSTNSQSYRAELNAAVTVDRPDAAATVTYS